MKNNRLDDQVAVVTGAGRGIGRATALLLAKAGASVVVTARSQTEIEETVELIRSDGGRAIAVSSDISDWSQVKNLMDQTEKTFGFASIVVANASVIQPVGLSWDVDPIEWEQSIRINLTGTFHTIRAFLPGMVAASKGTFIMISSGAANNPVPGWSAYCASKAGVDHYARTLTAELSSKEIPLQVYILYPGIVDTAMQKSVRQVSEKAFPQVDRFVSFKEKKKLRSPDQPAQIVWWLSVGYGADLHGDIVSIDDETIRQRVASDLGLPLMPGR